MTGSIEPLLDVLAGAGVRHLVSREPSLEELFLAHYGAEGDGRRCGVSEVYDDAPCRAGVAVTTARRAGRPGALWGLVFGLTIAATERRLPVGVPDRGLAGRARGVVPGQRRLRGGVRSDPQLDTVAGYTAYKSMFTLVILGAIWGLLIATRVAARRGGRRAVGAVPVGADHAGAGGAAGGDRARRRHRRAVGADRRARRRGGGELAKVGIGVGASLFFATAVVAAAAMFMAVGMLAGQLAATRHDANLIGAGVLAASYLVRMAADSDPGLAWLRWASPLGWIEELPPAHRIEAARVRPDRAPRGRARGRVAMRIAARPRPRRERAREPRRAEAADAAARAARPG